MQVLPLFYLGPIDYFQTLARAEAGVLLERHEHYQKQTYRNRARIYSPNGPLDLIIPVQHGRGGHTPIKDMRISYESRWQRIHWMGLESAYRRSAYFEFYEHYFAPFYEQKIEFLWDYNEALLDITLKCLKLELLRKPTSSYEKAVAEDYRTSFSPLKASEISQKSYFQVFQEKQGFLSNLSIIDLLVNKGPQAKDYLLP